MDKQYFVVGNDGMRPLVENDIAAALEMIK